MTGKRRVLLAGCSDPRNIRGMLNLLDSLSINLQNCDVIPWLVFGGIGNRKAFDEAVLFAMEELSPQAVVLTTHEDCKKGTDVNRLKMAMSFIETRWPEVELIGAWINLDGTWDDVVIEERQSVA